MACLRFQDASGNLNLPTSEGCSLLDQARCCGTGNASFVWGFPEPRCLASTTVTSATLRETVVVAAQTTTEDWQHCWRRSTHLLSCAYRKAASIRVGHLCLFHCHCDHFFPSRCRGHASTKSQQDSVLLHAVGSTGEINLFGEAFRCHTDCLSKIMQKLMRQTCL
jgi:hypothetical protein